MSARVDVVVPTFDNLPDLMGCLTSLEGQTEAGLRVLVCVDGSTDGTLEYLRSTSFDLAIEILEHPDRRNHGRAATRNLSLPHLTAPYVLFVDSDMRLEPGAAAQHLELLDRTRGISVGDVIYDNATANLWARYLTTRGKNKAAPGAQIRPLDFATGNTAMYSDDLEAVAGFDQSMTGYGGEDTELGLRLATERRLPFVFNAAARARSVERKTVADALAELDRFARTSLPAIRERHRGGPAPYWLDRFESNRVIDRLLRRSMNPISDAVARVALRVGPFRIQRRAIDYLVLRTVWRGYSEART